MKVFTMYMHTRKKYVFLTFLTIYIIQNATYTFLKHTSNNKGNQAKIVISRLPYVHLPRQRPSLPSI